METAVPAPLREGSIVALFDRTGRLLLQQRDDVVPPAGYGRWALPGGGREGNESPRETALREFEEETGVRLQHLRFFATISRHELPGLRVERLHFFFADDEVDPADLQVNEGLDFRFWSPAEIGGLLMNPSSRSLVERFLASDQYRGTLALAAPFRVGVSVIELDRWGRVLLQLRDADLPPGCFPGHWSLPGGMVNPGEAPDLAAFREFEEETGHLLETLRLFRVYRRDPELPTALVHVQHVYYTDADLAEELITANEGQAFRYFAPAEFEELPVPPHTRTILAGFFASASYRALFH